MTEMPDRPALRRRERAGFMPFRTPVRGHAFAAPPPGTPPPRPQQPAALRREPHHPLDPWAIGVWVDGPRGPWRIGYLDRGVAARLAPRLDRRQVAVDARVEGWWPEPEGRWQRPVVVLTPRSSSAQRRGADRAAETRPAWGVPARSRRRVVGRRPQPPDPSR